MVPPLPVPPVPPRPPPPNYRPFYALVRDSIVVGSSRMRDELNRRSALQAIYMLSVIPRVFAKKNSSRRNRSWNYRERNISTYVHICRFGIRLHL